jgi:hypothetical protein
MTVVEKLENTEETMSGLKSQTSFKSPRDNYNQIVTRLSKQSVEKHFEAYVDIDWEAKENQITEDDERWGLFSVDPLRESNWYKNLSQKQQRVAGITRIATVMKIGWEFENLLQRGLLQAAFRLPNGSPEFRYIHHEVIEESHHSMMFQELVNKTGLPVQGMSRFLKLLAELVVLPIQNIFPSLFFFFVLGGEDPIDHMQRQELKNGNPPELVKQIMKIHVTEEARHISFARQTLKLNVPKLSKFKRILLSFFVPGLMAIMVRLMVYPSKNFRKLNDIPFNEFVESIRSDSSRQLVKDAASKPRKLVKELGLMNPVAKMLWKITGLWDDESLNV